MYGHLLTADTANYVGDKIAIVLYRADHWLVDTQSRTLVLAHINTTHPLKCLELLLHILIHVAKH